MKGEIVGKFRRIVEIDVPLDALGRGMRPASDSRLGNHAQHGFGHGVDVPGPDRVIGLKAGLGAADTVRLVEKLDERSGTGIVRGTSRRRGIKTMALPSQSICRGVRVSASVSLQPV